MNLANIFSSMGDFFNCKMRMRLGAIFMPFLEPYLLVSRISLSGRMISLITPYLLSPPTFEKF